MLKKIMINSINLLNIMNMKTIELFKFLLINFIIKIIKKNSLNIKLCYIDF